MSARYLLPFLVALAGCASLPSAAGESAALGSARPEVPQTPFEEGCEPWDEWDKPARPFSLMGNTWYVGTCGIASILVTGEEGHILIDSGIPEAAPLVLANIQSLGFDPGDIRYILMSHEHYDHVGAHAELAAATGAQIIASGPAAPVLESGVISQDDPQFGSGHQAMTPVEVDRIMNDDEVLVLGDLELTAHATPGHTPGGLSWTWWSCSLPGEPRVCRHVAYVDSLSAVSADEYRFLDHPALVAEFRTSIEKVRNLPCDYLVTPHPSSSQLLERLREGTFGQQGECERHAYRLEQGLAERLAEEMAQ